MSRLQKAMMTLAKTMACGMAFPAFSSCTTFEQSGLPGSASSMAHNQIMLVGPQPKSFGQYRLDTLMGIHPDLAHFVSKRGTPDFLAETSNDHQHYFILYYLKDRQAFAARTRAPNRQRLEFAGPYPITDKEQQILRALKENPSGEIGAPQMPNTKWRSSLKVSSCVSIPKQGRIGRDSTALPASRVSIR